MDEGCYSKSRIRDAEKDWLAKIKQNPHKWNSKSWKFEMTTGISSTPSVGVKILKTFFDCNFTGPFNSDVNGVRWKTLGKIRIHKNFTLSLEIKMNNYPGNNWRFLLIGDWFGLAFRKADNGHGYILRLFQNNGLYNQGPDYNDTNQTPFSIHFGQWLKEF